MKLKSTTIITVYSQREDNLMFDVGGNSGIDSESISVKATMFGKGNGRIGQILDNA